MFRGAVTAIRTLTILPVPGRDADRLASALSWFPLVGLVLGVAYYGIALLPGHFGIAVWSQGVAALIVVCSVFLTRAMHLDGLADTADGFGCRGSREKILSVMKDPHTGAFGVIAVVLALLVRYVSTSELLAAGFPVAILAAAVVSRTMQAELVSVLPYARQEAGTAAPFVNGSRWWHRLVALIVGALILCAVCGPIVGGVTVVAAWVICRGFGWWCRKKIGGVTGDTIGACSEIVEIGVLFGSALLSDQASAVGRFWGS